MLAFRQLLSQDFQAAILTRNNVILDCNEHLMTIFNCADKTQFIGKSVLELLEDPQPDGRRFLESGSILNPAVKSPKSYLFYLNRMFCETGQGFWADFEVRFLGTDDGNKYFLIHVKEKDLNEKEKKGQLNQISYYQKLFYLIDYLPHVVMPVDAKGKLQYGNKNALRLLKIISKEAPTLKTEADAVNYLCEHLLKEAFQKTSTLREEQFSELYLSKNHQWWNVRFIPLINEKNKLVFIIIWAENITSIKRKELELTRSKDEFISMIEHSPDIICRYDPQLRHTYISPNVEKYTGLTPAAFLGKKISEVALFPPEIQKIGDKTLAKVFSQGSQERVAYQIGDKWLEWSVAPIFDQKGEQVVSAISTSRDITRYKNIQEELKVFKAKMLFALDIAKLASFQVDPTDLTLEVDERLAKIHGIDAKELTQKRMPFSEFFSRFSKNLVCGSHQQKEISEDFLLEEDEFVCEYQREIDGEVHYFLSKSKLIRNNEGELTSWFGVVQDITALKSREQQLIGFRNKLQELIAERKDKLIKSEESLEHAMKLARLGTWEYDPVKREFKGDEQIAVMLGIWEPGKKTYFVKVEDYLKLVHPLDYSAFENASRKAFMARSKDYVGHIEHRVTHANGDVHYIYFSIKFLLDTTKGKKVKFYGIAQDVTTFWESEAEVEMLSTLLESTPDIVLAFEKDFHLSYINRSGKRKLGIGPVDDIIDFSVVKREGDQYLNLVDNDILQQVIDKGEWFGELEVQDKRGMVLSLTGSIQKFDFTAYKTTFLAIFRDLTEQKKFSRDLRFKKNELDAYIKKASGDLRDPVTALKKVNRIIEQEVKDPKLSMYLDMFKSEINKLHQILLSLFDLTNIRSAALRYEKVDIREFVESCIADLKLHPYFEASNIQTRFECSDQIDLVPGLYRVILHSLLKNALDFSRRNVTSSVEVLLKTEGDFLIMEIKDNGQGMDEDIKQRAMEMFFRGNPESKGSGLGLYMVKVAVTKLNGQIQISTAPGEGTLVHIRVKVPINGASVS